MVSTFLAVYLLAELALSERWIGLIITVYGAGAILGSLVGGWLCSRVPPGHIILSSLFLMGVTFFFLSVIRSPMGFSALLFVAATFEGLFRPPTMIVLMGASSKHDRARCYSLYQTSLNLGYAIGAVGGGLLAEIDFALIFWVNGGTSVFAALVLLYVLPLGRRTPQASLPRAETFDSPRAFNWPLFLLCCAGFLNYCVVNQRLSIYPLYLTTDYGLHPSELGALLMLNGLLIAATGVLVTDWVKHYDQVKIAVSGSLLLCGSFAILPAGNSLAFAFASSIIMTFGEIMFMPSIISLVYSWSHGASAGRSMGLFFAINSACRAIGPMAGVWGFSLLGPTITWLICGGMGVATAVLLLGVPLWYSRWRPPVSD